MANKPVKIVETVLRDGHQSIAATRMRIVDMLPVLEKIDNAGYHAVEAWGGATFDSCLRFLHEDPWQRLRLLKKNLPHTPIQMLLRGQNVLGYTNLADDVVSEFVKRSVDNGVPSSAFSTHSTIPATLKQLCAPPKKLADMLKAVSFIPSVLIIKMKILCSLAKNWYRWVPTPSALRIWQDFYVPMMLITWLKH